jgi:hypothetical protein
MRWTIVIAVRQRSNFRADIRNDRIKKTPNECPGSFRSDSGLGVWIFGRCSRCFRSLSFRNLHFGWRLGWLLFDELLLPLFLRRFLNLFHFIFLSHGKHSSLFPQNQKLNGADTRLTKIHAWLTVYRHVTLRFLFGGVSAACPGVCRRSADTLGWVGPL